MIYLSKPICLLAAVVASLSSAACADTSATATRPPNIVFMMADDLGYTDLGCYGSSFYETPNLDKLAKQGMRFTNAYAACPVCSPSRAAFLAGKYPARMGTTDYFHEQDSAKTQRKADQHPLIAPRFQDYLDLKEETIAEALKKAGYKTFMAGKWHLGQYDDHGPQLQGFDESVGSYGAGHPRSYFSPYHNPRLPDGPDGEYLTDRISSETVKFIEKNHDKPFFVYLAFYAVHVPLQGRPDLVKKYEEKRNRLGLEDKFTSDGDATVRLNQALPVYAAMVEAMDQGVGSVTEAIHRLGLDDNTIVIFTSDNGGLSTKQGWPTSNVPLRDGKGWMYEGGIREPLIVRWPGKVKAGSETKSVVTGTDFYPTLLQAAGLDQMPQQHVDGKSMMAVLDGQQQDRGPIFWHYPHFGDQGGSPASAVRDGKWKLIKWYVGNRTELFDLEADLGEKNNLAAEHPEKVKELSSKLDSWLKETGAKFPTPNPDYKK